MGRKHKAAIILFLFTVSAIPFGASCSSQVARNEDPTEESAQTVDEWDQEEVVESDDGGYDDDGEEPASQKTAGFLMAIGYLAMTVGSALLPLLMI